ncbi:D-arabinitol 4-dehydrogenase [Vibrio palustris]|uniref:Mannitol 2-dehydrogenase n=1 Tax=Vibrio palustris TaxID=1918946 RepID=A0A1R4B4T2_9VIBR|nr:D-arabinitol 4-dehydrogenase [Vibrio palustris]SJL83901.1 Mannitol 2-dehydrogenase [Vibrio palustris]
MHNYTTWLHIGLGSFHRAHQAWYLHQLRQSGDTRWHIAAGNIRDDAEATIEALRSQNGEYMLETVSPAGERNYEVIQSIQTLLAWQPDLKPLINEGAKASTKVIAFTVTEAGYYLKTDHSLDVTNPILIGDLNGGHATIYGAVIKILQARMDDHAGPVTLLSCDNVRHNGERFRDGLLECLTLQGNADLLAWVRANTTCPNTMVDRITPRPMPDLPARVKAQTGMDDRAPVMGETFIQWVIEDNFIANRPKFENVGVEMVESVIPYEEAKIRILNASHSCIAWAGTLLSKAFIHESTLIDAIYNVAHNYVHHDVIPCLGDNGINLHAYLETVLERFTNPYIKDTNQRVAADGLSKIPAMITPTMIECYQRGMTPHATAMLPALFFVFMQQWHKGELPYEYQDSMLDESAMHTMFDAADPIQVYTQNAALFGELATQAEFATLIRDKISIVNEMIA